MSTIDKFYSTGFMASRTMGGFTEVVCADFGGGFTWLEGQKVFFGATVIETFKFLINRLLSAFLNKEKVNFTPRNAAKLDLTGGVGPQYFCASSERAHIYSNPSNL